MYAFNSSIKYDFNHTHTCIDTIAVATTSVSRATVGSEQKKKNLPFIFMRIASFCVALSEMLSVVTVFSLSFDSLFVPLVQYNFDLNLFFSTSFILLFAVLLASPTITVVVADNFTCHICFYANGSPNDIHCKIIGT